MLDLFQLKEQNQFRDENLATNHNNSVGFMIDGAEPILSCSLTSTVSRRSKRNQKLEYHLISSAKKLFKLFSNYMQLCVWCWGTDQENQNEEDLHSKETTKCFAVL